MMQAGTPVEHPEFGPGTVRQVLGGKAVVNFFGEEITVDVTALIAARAFVPDVSCSKGRKSADEIAFRRSYEAINLGIVPPDPPALIALTIGGNRIAEQVQAWLRDAKEDGLCKVAFGDYGTGKSHYLHVVRSIALQAGWVVSCVEFDPKAADPAKPYLVYREILSRLHFPKREDGSHTVGFRQFIREVRRNWHAARTATYLRENPWYAKGLEVLLRYPHSDEQDYMEACEWLAGQPVDLRIIRRMATNQGLRAVDIPRMPRTKEAAEIYVFHLVTMSKIIERLGYKGLLILLDEAEHVRGYSVRRKERANNFFDLLARCAMPPLYGSESPALNDHGIDLPRYWKCGPHFGVLVGLTEGDTFTDSSLALRDACVFLHRAEDVVKLHPPSPREYEAWCIQYLSDFHQYRPERTSHLCEESDRRVLASRLRAEFESMPAAERQIRTWVKLASLGPSVILAGRTADFEELASELQQSARMACRNVLPWEEH